MYCLAAFSRATNSLAKPGSELPTAAKLKVPQGTAQNTERNIPFRNRKYIYRRLATWYPRVE